ncbi:MAG: MFS transporter [Candidatus Planktophila sp.]|nr:MFS transporter [Candidatus Planktophila sp.]
MPQALPRKLVHRLVTLNALSSYVMGSLGFSIQLIKRDFDLTRVIASWHNIGWAAALVFISFILLGHGHRRPAHQTIRFGWALLILGSLVYCLSPNIYFSVPAVILTATGSVIAGNTTTAILGAHSKTAMKNMFRSTGAGLFMASVSPTVIGLTTQADIPWRTTVATTAVLIGLVALKIVPELEARPEPDHADSKILWNKTMIAILIFAFLTITMELSLSAWAVDLLTERGSEVKSAVLFATVAPYFVALTRIYLSTKDEHNLHRIWRFSFMAIASGVLLVIFASSPTLTLAGLIIAAAGIGPGASIAIAKASSTAQGSDRGIAAFVIGMGISNGTSPWIMGFVSENFGFAAAYTVILVALVLSTYLFVKINRKATI